MKKIYLFSSFFILFFTLQSEARHIIGGVISYECMGDSTFFFTMKVYRDCSDSQAAPFDNFAPVSVYRGSEEEPLTTFYVPFVTITDVEPPDDNPCIIIPPSVCVEEGIYTFEYTIQPWDSPENYTFAYQRCCRNNNITNILDPQATGATFSATLFPAAQTECNNSPVFDDFPPTVICAGEPLDFDHAATDPEGDLIIYELCAPIKGGGLIGTGGNPGDPNSCGGVTPDPACPPSGWEPVEYEPGYSSSNPIGGDPQVTINASTGVITGTPGLAGQFVVGVCASEFRNGVLMSVLQREFQFNVTVCEQLVTVDLPAQDVEAGEDFFYEFCDETEITFANNSYEEAFIEDYFWRFNFNGQDTFFNEWEPTIAFPETGNYPGVLILNPGSDCSDTANVFVNIFPDLNADFAFDYDTCRTGPVFFSDQTVFAGGQTAEWAWDFGDGQISDIEEPTMQFSDSDTYPVSLQITDENGCTDDTTIMVRYFPVPNLIVVRPSAEIICIGQEVTFENLSALLDSTYSVTWDFGDNETDSLISPTHIYNQAGLFDVSLNIVSPIGCETDTLFEEITLVKEKPRAGFTFADKFYTNFEPEISLQDSSFAPAFWQWFDDGEIFSYNQNPEHVFADTGWHELKLVVHSEEGCTDTLVKPVDVIPEVTYYLPNAFTPNWDTNNDLYGGKGFLRGASEFRMDIWNRYGEVVFTSDDPDARWNGRKNNNGDLAPNGAYVCHVSFTGPRGEPFEFKTFIELVR